MSANKSEIKFTVSLDENFIPESIEWQANDGDQPKISKCKSTFISLWDEEEKNTLRIDLWTKDMMVDEMKLFCVQTLITMADTFERATNDSSMAEELRTFGKSFAEKLNMLDDK